MARKNKLKNVLTHLEQQKFLASARMRSSAEENNFEIAQIHKQYHEAFAQGIVVCGETVRSAQKETARAGKAVK